MEEYGYRKSPDEEPGRSYLSDPWSCYEDEDGVCGGEEEPSEEGCGCCCC